MATSATLAAYKAVLATDPSASVRLAMLANVAKAQRSFNEARGIIADAARNDASAEVRDEAGKLLAEWQR